MAKKKYYSPDDYGLGQKVGAPNKQAVRNLFAEVYGEGKEQKEDHDFNRMLSGMISVIERNGLVGALKHEVVAVPVIRELELEQIEMNALKARMAEKKKKIQQMRDGK